jgi:hypothetical protein
MACRRTGRTRRQTLTGIGAGPGGAPATRVRAMRASLLVVVIFAALGGCGGGGGTPPADGPNVADAPPVDPPDATAADASPDAAPCPSLDSCGWLIGYQQEIVGKLSGQREIAPGVTLTRRASIADRTTARNFVESELIAHGYTPEIHQYATNGANVIATLPATSGSGGTIVLGAHFDGVPNSPAAADNATGTAMVLAAARYLATVPERSHPIVFALFDQEEIGLVGSEAFAVKLIADGTVVDAVHNFDMVSFDGDGDEAIELWSPSPSLVTAYHIVADPLGIPIQPVDFEFSDHQSFLDHGFTTVGVCEEFVADDHTPHYHEATDTYDKINFAYLAQVTRIGLTVVIDSATD